MTHFPVIQHDAAENANDKLHSLKAFTAARIALGRTGTSVPLNEALNFRLAHAHARDAVYAVPNFDLLFAGLEALDLPALTIKSKIQNRQEYLQRPDLGRQPDDTSVELLKRFPSPGFDVLFVIADGLSAPAVNTHAIPLLKLLLPHLHSAGLTVAPVIIAENARVAIGDETGRLLQAKMAIILIGERPGLSSANSMSAYLTFMPQSGLTDDMRNCVSNIRPAGLQYQHASDKIFYLVMESLRRKLSGVKLKDEMTLIG